MSQPPHAFPSRYARSPQLRGFWPPGTSPLPSCGPFRPPPQQFPPSPFPPFSGGGGSGRPGLPPANYPPPPFVPPPPPTQWSQQQPPEHPSPQWRAEAAGTSPWVGERPRLLPAVGPAEGAAPAFRKAGAEGSGSEGEGAGTDDERWLNRFLARHHPHRAETARPPTPGVLSAAQAGRVAAQALPLVAQLAALCGAWRRNDDAGGEAEAEAAMGQLAELRELVRPLRSAGGAAPWLLLRRKAEKNRQKRLRRRRERRAAREEAAARRAQREALVDRWRAKRAQEVEDRHREQELKAAADSVLSEVRKKQADTKRMAEILRGLEKLRKLRKEAAGRKGVCPPPAADEAFENEVQNLRTLIKQRTELYEAEERALRVMLEGEQEEERKRDLEKKRRKEKEQLMQQKGDIDSKLFGNPAEFPLGHLLEPFRQYYLQAEYSVPALIQIRHEWDRYLVPADHPEGSFIPPGWVLPSPPSGDVWATAVG